MHYLTQYYKNLAESLQQKIDHLTSLVEESESDKRELARINAERKADGKPPFKTLNQALNYFSSREDEARERRARD